MQKTQARRNLIARSSGVHCHSYPQLLFGWEGVTECEFNELGGRLDASHAAIVPHKAEHHFAGRQDNSELLVIDLGDIDPCLESLELACDTSVRGPLFAQPRVLALSPMMMSMVEFAMKQLGRTSEPRQQTLVSHQLAMLFVSLLYQDVLPTREALPLRGRLSQDTLNQLIDERLTMPPTNTELADYLHLGQSQLHLLCQRQFGMAPQQYVMRRRLQWARHWLRHSRRSVGELALELGFADISGFSRAYRRQFGYPPSQEPRSAADSS